MKVAGALFVCLKDDLTNKSLGLINIYILSKCTISLKVEVDIHHTD